MRLMIQFTLGLCFLLSTWYSVFAESTHRGAAAELLANAQFAVAGIVTQAREDPMLSSDNADAKPFWDGVHDVATNLDLAVDNLKAQNDQFFGAIANVAAGYAQAEVGRIMSGSQDTKLETSMKELGKLVAALYENYSKEAARLKQGGELTDSEKRVLEKLKAQQKELLLKLEKVEQQIGQGNEKIREGIKQLRDYSSQISSSSSTVHGFSAGLLSAHSMYNWMWGWHWWWGPWGAWAPGFININIDIWDDWADAYIYDWVVTEEAIELIEIESLAQDIELLEVEEVLATMNDALYTLEAGELLELTDEIEPGWDDVSTEQGFEVIDDYESNFSQDGIWGENSDWDTFESMGMDDFGMDFGDMDFDF